MEEELSVLIIQLKSLRLRETRILEQLERTRAQETRVIQQIEGTRERRRQARVEARAVVQQARQPEPPPPPVIVPEEIIQADPFIIGQRVRIINEVRRRRGHPAVTENDRRATVTSYDRLLDKVSIVTDNGFHTWRLSDNLRALD